MDEFTFTVFDDDCHHFMPFIRTLEKVLTVERVIILLIKMGIQIKEDIHYEARLNIHCWEENGKINIVMTLMSNN